MATKYPPFVNAYGKIGNVLNGIKSAAVPPKFTQDFLTTVLGLTSSSYRAMIPLLNLFEYKDTFLSKVWQWIGTSLSRPCMFD